tara:strand:+ start:3533 stop:4279 length:747 start_codon:yes stop_codon:yes gene_type:complete
MELISVIVPYFKKKNFIEIAINSILQQSYQNIEILLIYDDPDETDLEYLISIFGSNKKIRFIINKENIGAGLSRNKGILSAKGKFIGFLDADDYWVKEKTFKQIKFMKEKNYKISHTSYNIIDERGKYLSKRIAKNFYNYKEILKSCDIGLSTVILEKDLITNEIKFANLRTKEDFVLWLKLLHSGNTIGALDEHLVHWRRTKNSLSSFFFQKMIDGFSVYYRYMKFNFLKSLYYLFVLSLNYLLKNR